MALTITREDKLYRSQYVAYYLSLFADDIITRIESGDRCEKDIRKFVLLDTMLRTLMASVQRAETQSWGQVEVVSFTAGATIQWIRVNGALITSGIIDTTGMTSVSQVAGSIATNINNYVGVPDYAAFPIVAMRGTGDAPNGFLITKGTTGTITFNVVSNMQGGVDEQDEDDMCLDEDKMDALFQYISENTGLCFSSYNKTYTQPLVTPGGIFDDIGPVPTGPGRGPSVAGTGGGIVVGTGTDGTGNIGARIGRTGEKTFLTDDLNNEIVTSVTINPMVPSQGYSLMVKSEQGESQETI